MPLTKKGTKILKKMRLTYGKKKGKQVFYASANKGKIKGVHESLLTSEDIEKYSTEEEKKALNEKAYGYGVDTVVVVFDEGKPVAVYGGSDIKLAVVYEEGGSEHLRIFQPSDLSPLNELEMGILEAVDEDSEY